MKRNTVSARDNPVHLFVCSSGLWPSCRSDRYIFTSFLATGGGTVYRRLFTGELQEYPVLQEQQRLLFTCLACAPLPLWWCWNPYLLSHREEILPHRHTGHSDHVSISSWIRTWALFIMHLTANHAPQHGHYHHHFCPSRRIPYTIRSTAIIGQISPSVEEAAISLKSWRQNPL